MAARPNPPDDRNITFRAHAIAAALPDPWPNWAAAAGDDVAAEPAVVGQEDKTAIWAPAVDPRAEAGRALQQSFENLGAHRQLRPDQLAALRRIVAAAAPARDRLAGLETFVPGRIPGELRRPLIDSLPVGRVDEHRKVQ